MARLNDLTGMRFGDWLVLRRDGSTPNKAAVWLCKCTLCGSERKVVGASLTSGASTKCRKCVPRTALAKPHRNERIYHIYTAMKQRCYNKNSFGYKNYGGMGIKICKEWDDFNTFYNWAMANGYADNLTIDRIDCCGDYEPSNCRWVNYDVQSANRRNVHKINYNGVTLSLSAACREIGKDRSCVTNLAKRNGISIQDAFERIANITRS